MTRELILIKRDNVLKKTNKYYLGAWCLHQHEKFSSRMVKYPWDDRETMYKDFRTIKRYIHKYEKIFTKVLNKIHKTSHSYLFWKVQLYPWLGYTIISFFHSFRMYQSLNYKNTKWKAVATNINILDLAPGSSKDFISHFLNDDWNSYIFGKTMEHFSNCHVIWKNRDYELIVGNNGHNVFKNFLLKTAKRLKILFRIINRKKNFFLYQDYLPKGEKLKIDLYLNRKICPDFPTESLTRIKPNEKARNELANKIKNNSKNCFDIILQKNLFTLFPTHLLENFLELKRCVAHSTFPALPKLILTSIGQAYDDPFKYYYGSQPAHVKRFIVSHGGYGVARYCYDEDHDISICDKYLTWGWKFKKKQVKLGIQKTLNKKISANKNGGLLFLAITTPKINYTLDSCPRAGQNLSEIGNHIKFFKRIDVEIQKSFTVRAFEHGDQWLYNRRWLRSKLALYPKIMGTEKSFYKVIKNFRIAVVTWNATVVRELFSLDFPSLLIWDNTKYETHSGASEIYKNLVKANILFYNPLQAADFLNSIWSNIDSWWFNPKTRNARQTFCDTFARPFNTSQFKHLLKSSVTI